MRHRRQFAARNVAEDAYAGKLRKKYNRGETYIRKSALTSQTMRGSRLRIVEDKLALKSKLGQREGEAADDDNVIMQMLGGGGVKAKKVKKMVLDKPKPMDVADTLSNFCRPELLPPRAEKVMEKPKTLLQKQLEREAAKKAQIARNKYDVVFHDKRKSMYKSRYGKMVEPWTYASFSHGDALRKLMTGDRSPQ